MYIFNHFRLPALRPYVSISLLFKNHTIYFIKPQLFSKKINEILNYFENFFSIVLSSNALTSIVKDLVLSGVNVFVYV